MRCGIGLLIVGWSRRVAGLFRLPEVTGLQTFCIASMYMSTSIGYGPPAGVLRRIHRLQGCSKGANSLGWRLALKYTFSTERSRIDTQVVLRTSLESPWHTCRHPRALTIVRGSSSIFALQAFLSYPLISCPKAVGHHRLLSSKG